MSTSRNKGGGFFVGVLYGTVTSILLYLVLSFLYPIEISNASAPVEIASTGGAEPAEAAPAIVEPAENIEITESVSQPEIQPEADLPEAPATELASMGQPDIDQGNEIAVGGGGDSSPASVVNPQIVGTQAQAEPAIATASAEVPSVGGPSTETTVPGQSTVVASVPASADAAGTQVAPPAELSPSVSGPATEVFAVAFTGDSSKPMLAIILEDTLETDLTDLFATGTPLSFALPADVDSSGSARSIRQSGYEVVAMLPSGLSRQSGVEDNVRQFMQNVPVAVALLDASSAGLMLNRDSMQKVLDTTRPAGLGVITFGGIGTNIARDQALRAGAAYGNVTQIIDESQDIELILQALNRAALKAVTNGSAIVFARTRPETIEAVVRWLDGFRAQRVQMVPVSVAIQR